MPVKIVLEEDHLQLVLSIKPRGLLPGQKLDHTVDQMFEALEIIRNRVSDGDIYYFTIDIANAHSAGEEFVPWHDGAVPRWGAIAREARLHSRLQQWLSAVEDLIVSTDATAGRSTAGIWEHDETQFGEPAASVFALAHRSFIPFYTRLLKVWDLDHEVHQSEAIDAIVRTHGICPETEDLLVARACAGYGQGQIEDLFPYLQEQYGDFSNSALFRRMVQECHARDRAWRQSMPGKNLADRQIFNYCPSAPVLKEKAAAILKELDALAGPLG